MSIVPAGKEWLDESNREVWAYMLAAAVWFGVSAYGGGKAAIVMACLCAYRAGRLAERVEVGRDK